MQQIEGPVPRSFNVSGGALGIHKIMEGASERPRVPYEVNIYVSLVGLSGTNMRYTQISLNP